MIFANFSKAPPSVLENENGQAQSSSNFCFAEQTELALFSINPATHHGESLFLSSSVIIIVKQSRQPQHKLDTQKLVGSKLKLV